MAIKSELHHSPRRWLSLQIFSLVCLLALAHVTPQAQADSDARPVLAKHVIDRFGTPPDYPTGEVSDDLVAALETAFGDELKSGIWGPAHGHYELGGGV